MTDPAGSNLLITADPAQNQNLLANNEATTNDANATTTGNGYGPPAAAPGTTGGATAPGPGAAGGCPPVAAAGNGATPPHYPHGVVAALLAQGMTTEALARALTWQQQHATAGNQKEFLEKVCAQTSLTVCGWVNPGSNKVQLMWGIGAVHDLDCEDMINTLIGFVGDRDNLGGNPDVVKLPKENSWKWKTVKKDFDATKFEAFYGDTANRNKFRSEGADRTVWTEETLPRLIYLPGKIGQYAAEQPRTLFELYQFTNALETGSGGVIDGEATKLIKKYCIGACYEETTNSPDSIMTLKVGSAISRATGFQRLKRSKIEYFLGTAQPPTSTNGGIGGAATSIQQLGTVVTQLGNNVNKLIQSGSSQVHQLQQANDLTRSSKNFDAVEVAYLKGVTVAQNTNHLPPFWGLIQGMTKLSSVRSHFEQAMKKWEATTHIDTNHGIYWTNEFIKDILAVDLNASEVSQTYKKLERGLTPLICVPRSHEENEEARDRDRAEEETISNRTLDEALKLTASDPRHPPRNMYEFKLMAGTFAGACFVLTGHSPLYRDVLAIRRAFDEPTVIARATHFTPQVCAKFTWAMGNYGRQYLSSKLHPDDFVPGNITPFPSSHMALLLPNLHMASPLPDPTFPEKWVYKQPLLNRGGGRGGNFQQHHLPPYVPPPGGIPPPNGPPPGANKHYRHPKIVALMKPYIEKFGINNVSLTAICDGANTTVSKWCRTACQQVRRDYYQLPPI